MIHEEATPTHATPWDADGYRPFVAYDYPRHRPAGKIKVSKAEAEAMAKMAMGYIRGPWGRSLAETTNAAAKGGS